MQPGLISLVLCSGLSAMAFSQQPATDRGAVPPPQSAGATQTDPSTTADKPYHVGGDVTPPKAIHMVDPKYSKEARKAKFSGIVEVYLVLDENGKPTHVRVAKSAGMGLDEEAVKAVSQYKFRPAMKDGKPVKVDLYVDVNFHISRGSW